MQDSITLTIQFTVKDDQQSPVETPATVTKSATSKSASTSPTPQPKRPPPPPKIAVAVLTSCWTAPDASESNTQQRFHALGSRAEIRVDQTHRGYELTTDQRGYQCKNPLFMRLVPDENGDFVGQQSYAYQTYELWIESCRARNQNPQSALASDVATVDSTVLTTAILEAGRRSLDSSRAVMINKDEQHGYVLSAT